MNILINSFIIFEVLCTLANYVGKQYLSVVISQYLSVLLSVVVDRWAVVCVTVITVIKRRTCRLHGRRYCILPYRWQLTRKKNKEAYNCMNILINSFIIFEVLCTLANYVGKQYLSVVISQYLSVLLSVVVGNYMGHIQEQPPVASLYTILTLTVTLTRGLILDNAMTRIYTYLSHHTCTVRGCRKIP